VSAGEDEPPDLVGDNDEVKTDAKGQPVGYGRPPEATRFRKGVSGNPRGRPKGARNFAAIVSTTLNERIVITENGCRKRITKLEAAVKQVVNRGAGGDARSLSLLIALVQAIEAKPPQAEPTATFAADSNVLRELKRRLADSK
jgi:Family of unknown function (DUF5681)